MENLFDVFKKLNFSIYDFVLNSLQNMDDDCFHINLLVFIVVSLHEEASFKVDKKD